MTAKISLKFFLPKNWKIYLEKRFEKMTLDFFMPMIPPTATHQEKGWTVRDGKPVPYEPAEVKAARAKLLAHLGQHKPTRPMTGPVTLRVAWMFPKGNHRDMEPRVTRPDTDNLQKLLKDCMTKLRFWKDDAQVWHEAVMKVWAEAPGIAVHVEEAEA